MFENLLKNFASKMMVKLLPDLLRGIADQIERGGIVQVNEQTIAAAMEAHQDAVKVAAAELST